MSEAILLAGDGHGALSVFRGLAPAADVWVCTGDADLAAVAGERRVWDLGAWCRAHPGGLLLLAGYKPILDPAVAAGCRILNIHYSLLPKYRGLHSTVWAILNGEREVGFTIHELDHLVDHGDIVHQRALPVGEHTSWELMLAMDDLVEQDVARVVLGYLAGTVTPRVQDHGAATFVGRRNLEDCRVQWSWTGETFARVLKALVPPYPRPFFTYKGVDYRIVRAEVVHRVYREIPGHVVYRDDDAVWIKLEDGLLRLVEVEDERGTHRALDVLRRAGIRL